MSCDAGSDAGRLQTFCSKPSEKRSASGRRGAFESAFATSWVAVVAAAVVVVAVVVAVVVVAAAAAAAAVVIMVVVVVVVVVVVAL